MRQVQPPSRLKTAASYAVLTVSAAAMVVGITFAAWTSESLDLDEALMPVFESNFHVAPPLSFIAEVSVDELRNTAQTIEAKNDLAGAIVAWRGLQAHDPADLKASAALTRLMALLGEGGR